MNLTLKFKSWLVNNCDVDTDATDDEYKAAAAKALVAGDLSPSKLKSLSESDEDEEASAFKALLVDLKDAVVELKDAASAEEYSEEDTADDSADGSAVAVLEEDSDEASDEEAAAEEGKSTGTSTKGGTPAGTKGGEMSGLQKMIVSVGAHMDTDADGDKSFSIRVKEAADNYSSTKSAMSYPEATEKGTPHPFAGRQVRDEATGRSLDHASDRDKAVAGAFAQFEINRHRMKSRRIAFDQLPQHSKELLCYAMENEKWGGASDGGNEADIKDRKLSPSEQKALIDDATSGGLEAAPIVFDDQVIQTPLLHGELYPLVNTKPLDRGRRVEGVATGTVTATWGGVDDSAISLFNTASYVSAFDTTIFRWEGAIRIGLDFLSDTPIDFGQHVTSQYGERLMEDLDDVIATGNGTTQPEGVMNKTGATSVAWGGATSLGNYESTRFGVSKAEHRASVKNSAVWIGTETSYQRARAIPVGASDARRLGGMTYDDYSWMQRPYKINESLTNAQIAYVILARYRMYRRRGLTMRTSTEGDTLIRANEMLIVAMARYGGQLERGAVCARTTTAPA